MDERQVDPNGPVAKAAYQDLSEVLLDQQFVIDLVVLANLHATTSNLQGVSQNEFSALDLDNAYLA